MPNLYSYFYLGGDMVTIVTVTVFVFCYPDLAKPGVCL